MVTGRLTPDDDLLLPAGYIHRLLEDLAIAASLFDLTAKSGSLPKQFRNSGEMRASKRELPHHTTAPFNMVSDRTL